MRLFLNCSDAHNTLTALARNVTNLSFTTRKEAGVQRVKIHLQKCWFGDYSGKSLKILAKACKIRVKYLKTFKNSLKIWANSLKKWAKMGAQHALIWKNGPQNDMKSFSMEVTYFWCFFRASLGEFRQKSFAPQKNCLLVHLCSWDIAIHIYDLNLKCYKCARLRFHCAKGLTVLRICAP